MLESSQVPEDKLYFKIGEVSKIVGVKPYVLRYWETEFSVIKPGKTRSKHRLYRRKDVETLLRIKDLLHGRRYTIEGARKALKGDAQKKEAAPQGTATAELGKLRKIRDELIDLREKLS